jgi:hypothetical protein
LAAQLAADLGKAASGDTVTLSGGVRLQTALTVPVGVTLEITGDGGLWLEDGVILTVNGTVTSSVNSRIGITDSARSATINGSGTIKLLSRGNLLAIHGANKKLTLDGVTLVGLPDNDSQLVWIGEGGELVLKSGAITGNTSTSGWTGGVYIGEKSTFTMEGGTITGNASGNAAVWVAESSTFTMKSGEISGNKCRGVFVLGATATFIMEGGEISGNPGNANCGQGVAVNKGTFIMKGGVIHGNAKTSREGGGVFVTGDGYFEMIGGRIQGSRDSDGFTGNIDNERKAAALHLNMSRSKWGTGGTYTIGGVSQLGGSEIVAHSSGTNDTLIATPGK